MSKPFRFAIQCFNASSGAEWAGKVQRAEALGYSAFHLADHIIGEGPALTRSNHPLQNLAAIPAMAYAAAVTDTIKIGCRVFCVDYHDPVVLIKSAMTIDVLSGGRLELGLGAGWLKDEYAAIGLEMDSPGTRIKRLGDVIEGVKAYASEEQISLANDTLQWSEFDGSPKPIQKPHPPIILGGAFPYGGQRAIEYADGWLPHATRPAYGDVIDKFPEFKEMCMKADRDPYDDNDSATEWYPPLCARTCPFFGTPLVSNRKRAI